MALFNDLPRAKKEQEELLFAMAQFVLETSVHARVKGILDLENVTADALPVSGQSKAIIKRLLTALTDGMDLPDLADIASYSIIASESACSYDGEKLAMMMMAEGVISIQQGANPYVIGMKLASMLGVEMGDKLLSSLDGWLENFRAKYPRDEGEEEDAPNEAVSVSSVEDILFLDDKTIHDFSAANPGLLVPALVFVDDEIKQKVLRCVSSDEKERIEKELSAIEKPTLESREKLLTLLRSHLQDAGYVLREV